MAETEQKPLSSRLSETLLSNPESEVSRWRRMFDRYAKEGPDGVKWVTMGNKADEQVPRAQHFYRCRRTYRRGLQQDLQAAVLYS